MTHLSLHSPSYPDLKRALHTKVYLNGYCLPMCVEADDEEGYAIVHALDGEGKPFPESDGEIATIKVYGEITFEEV